MYKNIKRSRILLFSGLVLFLIVLLLMLSNAYKAEKEQFTFKKQYYLSSAFFKCNINDGIMRQMTNTLIDSIESGRIASDVINQNLNYINAELKKATISYDQLEEEFRKSLRKEGINNKFKLNLVICSFILRTEKESTHIYGKDSNRNYLVISGKINEPNLKVPDNSFYYRMPNSHIEVAAYLEMENFWNYYFRKIRFQIIGSFIIFFLFVSIVVYTAKTIKKQQLLNEMKTDFINNMTHELKTPLSTLRIASRTLQTNNSETIYTVDIINKQVNRLDETINKVMNLSLLREGQLQLKLSKTNINELIETITEEFKLNDDIQIEFNKDSTNPYLIVDLFYMQTAISNILENSIKYCQKPIIEVKTSRKNNNFVLSISDNGPGIPKINQKYVFDKFYRVPTGDLHEVKGSGLGLHYVQLISQAHQGKAILKSEPGTGTTVSIIIPEK